MGPQLYRCGNSPSRRARSAVSLSLQWGRNFIVAEILFVAAPQSRHINASMGPQLYRCGNVRTLIRLVLSYPLASMGPQLYRCGNYAPILDRRRNICCFNGAATLSLRKQINQIPCYLGSIKALQWGRNFIVAETD